MLESRSTHTSPLLAHLPFHTASAPRAHTAPNAHPRRVPHLATTPRIPGHTHIGGGEETSQKHGCGRGDGATQQVGGGGEDNDVAWEWLWGPRTAAEIGEAAVAQFVAELMAERTSHGGGSGAGGAGGSAGAMLALAVMVSVEDKGRRGRKRRRAWWRC
jgi:hypothetical protein